MGETIKTLVLTFKNVLLAEEKFLGLAWWRSENLNPAIEETFPNLPLLDIIHTGDVSLSVFLSHTQTNRQIDRQTDKQTNRQTHRHTDTQTYTHKHTHTVFLVDTHTNTYTNTHTNTHTHKHTHKHTHTQTHTHTHTHTHTCKRVSATETGLSQAQIVSLSLAVSERREAFAAS